MMHNSLQLIDRTCEYNEASSYERRRSAMNNPGAVELKRVEIGSGLISPTFRGCGECETMRNGIKKGGHRRDSNLSLLDENELLALIHRCSLSDRLPQFMAIPGTKHGRIISIVRGNQLSRSISVLVASMDRSSVRVYMCVCVCTFLIRSREKDPPPAFLLLPRLFFSLNSLFTHTYVHISPSSIHASMDFFTGVGYERLIFLLPLISHRRETRLAVNFLSEHCSYCLTRAYGKISFLANLERNGSAQLFVRFPRTSTYRTRASRAFE